MFPHAVSLYSVVLIVLSGIIYAVTGVQVDLPIT